MRWLLAFLTAVHGAIHLMGVAKAFGLAELPQLAQPISRGLGVGWLGAALALIAAAAGVAAGWRGWWAPAAVGVILSQAVIVTSWSDAKYGTVANVLIAVAAVYGFASQGPLSLRAEYRRDVQAQTPAPVPASAEPPRVTEREIAGLPAPVQRYLHVAGAVGQPRVQHVRARWRGRIRSGPGDPWMTFTAEQQNVVQPPARLFFMDAVRGGLPVDVYHAFRNNEATMRVRLVSLVPLVSAAGPEMTRAETVTLFNDLCLLAPGALVDPAIEWEPVDDRSVRARYTVGANTIGATLLFNDAGELVDFVSDDRLAQSSGGAAWTRQRWSTPVTEYRQFGPWRVSGRGEGRWHPPSGPYAYIELELLELELN